MPDILGFQDFLLAPLFFLIIWAYAKYRRDKKYGSVLIAQYYLPALNVRLLGNFLAALIYQYYYHGGDTFEYFWGISRIWEAFIYRPSLALELIFEPAASHSWEAISFRHPYLRYPDTGAVLRIGGFFSLLTAEYVPGNRFFDHLSHLWGLLALIQNVCRDLSRVIQRICLDDSFYPFRLFFWNRNSKRLYYHGGHWIPNLCQLFDIYQA